MNPYGIQQVDVPGLLAVYQNAQDRRTQQMKERRLEDRQARQDDIMSRIFAPKSGGGMGGAYGAANIRQGENDGFAGTGAASLPSLGFGAPQSLVDPSQLAPRTDGVQLNQDALRELYQFDPQTALQLQTSVYNANKQQIDQMQRYGEAGLGIAYRLKRLPPEQRAAELQASLPLLQNMGIDTSQLAHVDLSDEGLSRYEAVFGKLADLQPKLRNVGPGDMIIDERQIGSSQNPTVYESPFVRGEDGVIYERKRGGPQAGTIEDGYRFKGGNPADRNNWEPVGSGPPPISAAPRRPNIISRDAYQAWVGQYGREEADAMMKRNGLTVGNY